MILYTPLSKSDIYPEDHSETSKRKSILHEGKLLYVEESEPGSYQLLQLLSTDPQDFLDAKYSPGENIF
ncbi:MAG TPA: YlzJ-like family protein [Virgibacillus sp.]|nr:YlzJ-like family protein [Virgibacillus sp.]